MSAPRLLLVTQTLGPGGAERQVAHLAVGLARLGYPVTLGCLGDAPVDLAPFERDGVRVVTLGALTPRMRARAMGRIVALARGADVVICSSWDATFWGRVAAIVARRPAIVVEHAVYRELQTNRHGKSRASWIALHNRLLDPLTYATVACARAQIPVLRSEGVAERKIVLIPNGVPVDELRAAAAAGPGRAELGIPDGARVIVHVARLTALKNQRQTIATGRALRERLGADVHVLLVGPGEDRDALAHEAAGEPWVHLLGARDDVPALLALGDLAVLPSLAEAMPMVVAEAAAQGVPMVAYDVGDVGAILARTGAGIAVPRGDGDAFTDVCARLLSDERQRRALAEAARAAADEFDAATMARRYGLLAEAAAARRRPHEAGVDAPR